jgi:hypothetical protein
MTSILKRFLLFFFNSLEALIWLVALTALATVSISGTHFTLCPLSNLGFQYCPGCGLGHSISMIFHGQFIESLQMHPFGFPAIGLLSWRIVSVFRNSMRVYHSGLAVNFNVNPQQINNIPTNIN